MMAPMCNIVLMSVCGSVYGHAARFVVIISCVPLYEQTSAGRLAFIALQNVRCQLFQEFRS